MVEGIKVAEAHGARVFRNVRRKTWFRNVDRPPLVSSLVSPPGLNSFRGIPLYLNFLFLHFWLLVGRTHLSHGHTLPTNFFLSPSIDHREIRRHASRRLDHRRKTWNNVCQETRLKIVIKIISNFRKSWSFSFSYRLFFYWLMSPITKIIQYHQIFALSSHEIILSLDVCSRKSQWVVKRKKAPRSEKKICYRSLFFFVSVLFQYLFEGVRSDV